MNDECKRGYLMALGHLDDLVAACMPAPRAGRVSMARAWVEMAIALLREEAEEAGGVASAIEVAAHRRAMLNEVDPR
jgi:hypothetical protein